MVRAGLQIDVQRAALGFVASVFKSQNFGMLHTVVSVSTRADDGAMCVRNKRADKGIGRSQANALTGKIERKVEKLFVSGVIGHSPEI